MRIGAILCDWFCESFGDQGMVYCLWPTLPFSVACKIIGCVQFQPLILEWSEALWDHNGQRQGTWCLFYNVDNPPRYLEVALINILCMGFPSLYTTKHYILEPISQWKVPIYFLSQWLELDKGSLLWNELVLERNIHNSKTHSYNFLIIDNSLFDLVVLFDGLVF